MPVTATAFTPSPYLASALANLPKRTADSPVLKTENERVQFCNSIVGRVDPSKKVLSLSNMNIICEVSTHV